MKFLLDNIFLKSGNQNLTFAYFELSESNAKKLSKTNISSKIQIVNESKIEKSSSLKYPEIKISIRNEAFSLQDFIDFQFSAVEFILSEVFFI